MSDPYKILGINQSASDDDVKTAYRNLIREFAGNDEKITELTSAYDYIMHSRRGGFQQNSEFVEIRHQIQLGDYDTADLMLSSIDDYSAEWYFLKGSICYGRGWLDDAYKNFTTAVELDPNNQEYSSALNHMKSSRRGNMNGNPNPYSEKGFRDIGGCGVCNVCQGLICADCCCECMGGDCIPCC